jgi:hypothetical protein
MNAVYFDIKHSETLKNNLFQAVGQVRQALVDFSQVLQLQDTTKQCHSVVFSLIDKGDDKITQTVNAFYAERALQETMTYIFSFEMQKDSQQDTKKLAGFIQTGLSVEALNLHISRINSAKAQCKKIITSIKDVDVRKQADKRFYFVHHLCGFTHLVTNELYRQLVHINEPVDSIYFGLEKHNKIRNVYFPKAKATLLNTDPDCKAIVRKKHNSLPIFLSVNSELLARNKNGKKKAIRHGYQLALELE